MRARLVAHCIIPSALVILFVVSTPPAFAQSGVAGTGDGMRLQPLPRDLEMSLALSSLPPHLRAEATVWELDPEAGFVVAREGSNGFHALVARTDPSAFRGDWPFVYRDDILLPIAFDAAGAAANMRVYLDIATLQASGTPADELKRTINERFDRGYYAPPARAGVSYMLAPITRGYRRAEQSDEVATVNFPHYMFYAPGLGNADIGGARDHVFVFASGPHAYMIHLASPEERAAINREHVGLLEELCELRDEFCLPELAKQRNHDDPRAPEPVSDYDWTAWLVGEWQGWFESEEGRAPLRQTFELAVGGRYIYTEIVMNEGQPQVYRGIGVFQYFPSEGTAYGNWFGAIQTNDGRARREGDRFIWEIPRLGGTVTRVRERVSEDEYLVTNTRVVDGETVTTYERMRRVR